MATPSKPRRKKPGYRRAVRVLLVEDDPVQRELMRKGLELHHLRVGTAPDGKAALAEVGRKTFHALITDLHLPDMTGLEVARRIRETKPGLPVILVTSSPDRISVREAGLAGISEFHPKPVEFKILAERIRTLVDETPGHSWEGPL